MRTKYLVNNLSGQTINGQAIDPKYKVFTALLTQSGGDGPTTNIGDETFYKGITYLIVDNPNNEDLSSIGAPNNNVGTYFICSRDVFGEFTVSLNLGWNTGAPVVTVLENTIGNIWFSYAGSGAYTISSNGLFTDNKTIFQSNTFYESDYGSIIDCYTSIRNNTSGAITLKSFSRVDGAEINNALYNTPIEIRVYN